MLTFGIYARLVKFVIRNVFVNVVYILWFEKGRNDQLWECNVVYKLYDC